MIYQPLGCSVGWMYVLHAGASEPVEPAGREVRGDTIRSGGIKPPLRPTGLVSAAALLLGNECTSHFFTSPAHTHTYIFHIALLRPINPGT